MHKKSGIIAGMSNKTIAERLLKLTSNFLTLKAYAEEKDPEDKGGTDSEGDDKGEGKKAPTINFDDLITKARNEEKQRQYKKIEKLQTQVTTLTEQHNGDLLRIAELEEEVKTAKEKLTTAGKGDDEAVKTLKGDLATLEKEKKDLEEKIKEFEKNKPVSREEIEKEVRTALEAEYAVKTHRAEILAEHKDELLVPELVMGDTVEDLDKSLEAALARSKEIAEKLGGGDNKGGSGDKKPQKRTPKTPNNPSTDKVQDKGYTLEYLASLDVSSAEYKEVRKALGLK